MKTETHKSVKHNQKPRGAQSIQRAIKVLNIVAQYNDQGINLSAIAHDANLHVATAHRILAVLKSEDLITYDSTQKNYHLGMALYQLGSAAQQFAVRDRFRTMLEQLARKTEDTAFLLVKSGNDALCVDRVEGKFPIRTLTFDVSARRPLGIGAGGLALFAFLPDDQVEKIINANEGRYHHYNQRTSEDVRTVITQSRKLGFAFSKGSVTPGASAVALPVYNKDGDTIAGVSVAAIDQRMDSKRIISIAKIIRSEIENHGYQTIGDSDLYGTQR